MSDLFYKLEGKLSPEQRQAIREVQQAAERAQMNLFLTGGAVRDLMAGVPIRDLDFSVEGAALKLIRQLDRARFTVLSVDGRRQSAELRFAGAVTLEIAACRSQRYAKTGAAPEVTRAGIQEDLRRRDFSINAVAISLNTASRGLLLDPSNGLADIERKELRVLSTYSFYDDPARLLRLVRLESRLQYAVEERTRGLYQSAREAKVEQYLTPRSLLVELRQLAAEPAAAEAVKALASAGLLAVFHPQLEGKIDAAALGKLDRARRSFEEAGLPVDSFGPFLHCLTAKLNSAARGVLRQRTGLRGADSRSWTGLESRAKALQRTLAGKQLAQPSRAYRLLAEQDAALLLYVLAFSPLAPVREKIRNYLTKLRPLARSLDDHDLDELGVKRDTPRFARLREAYLTARLDNKIKSKADAAKVLGAV